MKLAILFWFYKDEHICVNRLKILRFFNKKASIFGLYGGKPSEAKRFKDLLSPYLDSFFAFTATEDSEWKWINGDLMIAEWYKTIGNQLEWDTIVIVQADMLLIGKVDSLFSGLKRDELLLSNLRPIKEVMEWWPWMKPPLNRYPDFLKFITEKYDYSCDPLCCVFVVACLPRVFLERYSNIENPEAGFIEYRIPIYAQLFNLKIISPAEFKCWRMEEREDQNMPEYRRVLNANKIEISIGIILLNLLLGRRIFHPYERRFSVSVKDGVRTAKRKISYMYKKSFYFLGK
jgi:hypothetical protein